jgi:hypothetical protein
MNQTLQHHWKEAVSRTLAGRAGARDFLSRADERALADQAGGYYRDSADMCERMEQVARQGYDAAIAALTAFVLPEDCQDIETAGQAVIAHLKALPASRSHFESLGVSRAIADLRQAVALQSGKIRLEAGKHTGP